MKFLRVMAVGATVGGIALAMTTQQVGAQEWTLRTVEQIKKDINKNGHEYIIVWGDTLSGISEATNISVQKLSDINKISDIDWICEGNKLILKENIASIQNSRGEIIAQSEIQNQDKVNPSQPVGQPVISQETASTNKANNTVADNTQASDQTTVTQGNITSNIPENKGDSTQIPTQSDNNSSQENTGGGQTTPSNPGNNEGNQGGSMDENNGSTNPSTPQASTIIDGYIGNSGRLFDTAFEANVWADGQLAEDSILGAAGNGWQGFELIAVFYSDGSKKFSINFY
ncbi:LysM peptidoglycan-binding domain-containing protein [Enterococcus durans]|uniref:LysM peptidoglycan-binding domain-containing protein n=1 Tax=Enterococcus durans TaxID=53345 RepID=UPI0011BE9F48|nr:LysM peptidoglycan-binding domain-containing protein [Enterococcus durans]QED59895.1 LysM peptidoglycan-binding domain-containing protein [Enterococcus durans]QED62383.1 LysM peptidoglycan-binding domain-containing protein [Enterococcus durans]